MLSKNEDIADVIRVHLKNSGGILVAGLDQTINQKLLNVLLKMIPDEMSVTTFFREVFSVVAYVNSGRMEFKKVLGVNEEGILLCEEL